MTYEKAIEYIECGAVAQCCCASNKKHGGDCDGENAVNEALAIAIKALEKQISKKPIAKHYEENGEHPYIKYACPICKNGVSAVKENEKAYQNRFCHKCGQAIDWSDE